MNLQLDPAIERMLFPLAEIDASGPTLADHADSSLRSAIVRCHGCAGLVHHYEIVCVGYAWLCPPCLADLLDYAQSYGQPAKAVVGRWVVRKRQIRAEVTG